MRKLLYLYLPYFLGFIGVLFSATTAYSQPSNIAYSEINETINPNIHTRSMTFAQLGRPKGLSLSGLITSDRINSGVRLDELITQAELDLKLLYPPGLEFRTSYLRVLVNDQLAGLYPLNENQAGAYHNVTVPLVTDYFTDFAEIKFEFEGIPITAKEQSCISPNNPSLRLDIAPESKLVLHVAPLPLVNDLALLPAPFFDPRDSNRLTLPFVLPNNPDRTLLHAAGLVASWFGAQASYRQALFKRHETIPTEQHSIIFSLGDKLPNHLSAQQITGPMLVIDSLPNNPAIKQLYILGRTPEELNQAALALVLEDDSLSGSQAIVNKVVAPLSRKPYDAPRYVPTHRPVYFYELIDYPTQLEASTSNPETVINLRLPPDLFNWSGTNIDLGIKYRYTPPSSWNDSTLNIEINRNLLQSIRLAPLDEKRENRFNLGVLNTMDTSQEEQLQIPAFRISGNNQMHFRFNFAQEGSHNCSGLASESRGAIDPESMIDFSGLPHYIKMPNLAAFANAGYPYSIYADLSQTAIVLPDQLDATDQAEYLNLMGLFGQWTGIAAFQFQLLTPDELAKHPTGLHWITFGEIKKLTWLAQYNMTLPMVLEESRRSLGNIDLAKTIQSFWKTNEETFQVTAQGRALIQSPGEIGAILSFESPFAQQKTGIIITGNTQTSYQRALRALSSYADVAHIRGSVALIRGQTVQSYQLGDTFVMGNLPWYLQVRIVLSKYPSLVATIGVFAGFILAILLFGWLAKGNRRRKSGV